MQFICAYPEHACRINAISSKHINYIQPREPFVGTLVA